MEVITPRYFSDILNHEGEKPSDWRNNSRVLNVTEAFLIYIWVTAVSFKTLNVFKY